MDIDLKKAEIMKLIRDMAEDSEIEKALEQLIAIAHEQGYTEAEDELEHDSLGEDQ